MDLYDLYETDKADPGTTDLYVEERPYRERHRVEVQPQDISREYGRNEGRRTAGPEADLLTGSSRRRIVHGNTPGAYRRPEEPWNARGAGTGTRRPEEPWNAPGAGRGTRRPEEPWNAPGTGTGTRRPEEPWSAPGAGTGTRRPEEPWNAPGAGTGTRRPEEPWNARGTGTGTRTAQGGVPDSRRELSADLFVPKGNQRRYNRYLADGRTTAARRSGGYQPPDRPQQYRTGQGFYFPQDQQERSRYEGGQPRRRTSYTDQPFRERELYGSGEHGFETGDGWRKNLQPQDGRGENRRPEGGRGESRRPQDGRGENRRPEDGRRERGGESGGRDQDDRRRLLREQRRKEREKQLRRMYLMMGAGVLVLLLVLFFLIRAAIGLIRPGPSPEKEAATTASQTESDQTQPTETGQEGTADARDEGTASGQKEDSGEPPESSSGQQEGQAAAGPDEAGQAEIVQDSGDGQESGPRTEQEQAVEGEQGDSAVGQEPVQQEAETDLVSGQDAEQPEPAAANPETAGVTAANPNPSSTEYAFQDDWKLVLVNPWHRLPEGYVVETTTLLNGESVDSRCYTALSDMLEDCQASGGTPIVCSSYRPHDKQVRLFEEQVASLMTSGLNREDAEREAGTVVAVPGTSEHELGLAVDICDTYNQMLDASQADTVTQQWLMQHCWEYGFILRYPENKSDITGIIYEPWHYRYVGPDAAAQIRDRGICLEEYLSQN